LLNFISNGISAVKLLNRHRSEVQCGRLLAVQFSVGIVKTSESSNDGVEFTFWHSHRAWPLHQGQSSLSLLFW
jgi:hypothetical protein